jgi:5-formyltetrahydrofolate cyclo-ligase
MNDSIGTKADLRRQIREMRKRTPSAERARVSRIICAKLASDKALTAPSGPIAVYLASPMEIDLSDFIRQMLARGIKTLAPRWNGTAYDLAEIKGLSSPRLRAGPMNILEPAEADITEPQDVAVWIVPGLAFTSDGKRLAYGGGWYDRLLTQAAAGSLQLGVAHAFHIAADLPSEPHDIPLDRIISDERL